MAMLHGIRVRLKTLTIAVSLFIIFVYYFDLSRQVRHVIKHSRYKTVNMTVTRPAYRICKPGPPLGYPEPESKLKNCLVIGDSISVGYTEFLVEELSKVCRVQRSPVDTRFGGARDSRYGRHCLPMLLRTTSGNSSFYDVIVFNFGVHDVTFLYDKKFMDIPLSEYISNLASITEQLGLTGAKLVFLTTTPGAHNSTINQEIITYNREAVKIMSKEPKISVYDLYQAIVDHCHGDSTDAFTTCGIFRQNDLHFTTSGSKRVAAYIADVLRNILNTTNSSANGSSSRSQPVPPDWISCPGNKAVVGCPPGSSCCKTKYTDIGVGCCHLSKLVECGDDNHYCDQGWICDAKCWVMKCFCHKNITKTMNF